MATSAYLGKHLKFFPYRSHDLQSLNKPQHAQLPVFEIMNRKPVNNDFNEFIKQRSITAGLAHHLPQKTPVISQIKSESFINNLAHVQSLILFETLVMKNLD